MEVERSQLARAQSAKLCSSPTIRSSLYATGSELQEEDDEMEEGKRKRRMALSSGRRISFIRFVPVFCLVFLVFFIFFCVSFFFYLRREETPASESFLLGLIFLAAVLFYVSKNRNLINHNFAIVRQLSSRFFRFRVRQKQVQWFIGEPNYDNRGSDSSLRGVEFYENGDFYEGEFRKGKCNGSGVYNYYVNGRYEGDWIDGKYDGYGIESWARGSRYSGQYRQGLRHGYGVYRFYSGDSYAGEWFNGQSHGVGVQTCANGSCYMGEFKHGVKHGCGVYLFSNGDRYAGQYFADRVHGFGVYHYVNGHSYEGCWHEGHVQGHGLYTFPNGKTRCGDWSDGSLVRPLPLLARPVLLAVQAARRYADEAIHIHRVDEHVNRAVQAACQAAAAARIAAVKMVHHRVNGMFGETNV